MDGWKWMNGLMNKWKDKWMNKWIKMNEWMNKNEWMDHAWINGWTDRVDGWMNG